MHEGGHVLYVVGYYAPYEKGNPVPVWQAIADCGKEEDARELVHYLNGGDISQ
jgi:hypothetical protein